MRDRIGEIAFANFSLRCRSLLRQKEVSMKLADLLTELNYRIQDVQGNYVTKEAELQRALAGFSFVSAVPTATVMILQGRHWKRAPLCW